MDCKQFNFEIENNLGKPYENMAQDFIAHITSCHACREVFEDHNCMHDLLKSSKSFLASEFNKNTNRTENINSKSFLFYCKSSYCRACFFCLHIISIII